MTKKQKKKQKKQQQQQQQKPSYSHLAQTQPVLGVLRAIT